MLGLAWSRSMKNQCSTRRRTTAGTQPLVDNLYQGMTLDAVTGLYYERFRDYSPILGRWMEQDPAQYINGANTYQFVDSSPVGNVDPSGLETLEPDPYVELPNFNVPGLETGGGGELTAPSEAEGPGGPEFTPSPGGDAAEGGGSPVGNSGGGDGGPGEGAAEPGAGAGTETPEAPASEPAPTAGTAPVDYPSMGELASHPGLARFYSIPEEFLGAGEPATESCPASGAAESTAGPSASSPVGRSGQPIDIQPGTNEPSNIGGRDYSGHALDRMQERGVPPSAVENTIQNGIPTPGNTPDTTVHYDPANDLTAVTDSASGRVVTVHPGE
ncbi:MAG: RHS repeat-associated core domain-containing protein [Phycisphaerae bacterium]